MDVILSNNLRLRSPDGGENWPEVGTQLVSTSEGRFVIMSNGATEIDRIQLESTSSVFETTLGANTFEVVTTNKIVHFSTASIDVTTTWIKYLRDSITKCSPYPTDGIFKEALLRQKGDSYDVKFNDHKPLGIVLERSAEWALVKVAKSDANVQVGSALSAIDDNSVALNTYVQTIERLKNWTPPLKLTFRSAPERRGYLMKQSVHKKNRSVAKVVWKKRYFTLAEGTLIFSDTDATTAKVMGEIPLMGGAVNLVPHEETGREHCFKVLSGVSSLVVQAETVDEMFDWACALYYGMSIANGGGYVLAMEIDRISGNKSKKDFEADALARATAMQEQRLSKERAKKEERSRANKDEQEEEDRHRRQKEAEKAAHEAAEAEAANNRLADMLGKKATLDETTRSGHHAGDDKAGAGVHLGSDGTSGIDRNLAEMVSGSQFVEEPHPSVLEDEAEVEGENIVYGEKDTQGEAGEHTEDAEAADAEEVFKMQDAVTEKHDATGDKEKIQKVFAFYAKTADGGEGYINVMQFSTIWRLATGVKGNLFKEMQIFNQFDLGGKGMLVEEDFVAGWMNLADTPNGELYLKNLKKLVDKDDNVIL